MPVVIGVGMSLWYGTWLGLTGGNCHDFGDEGRCDASNRGDHRRSRGDNGSRSRGSRSWGSWYWLLLLVVVLAMVLLVVVVALVLVVVFVLVVVLIVVLVLVLDLDVRDALESVADGVLGGLGRGLGVVLARAEDKGEIGVEAARGGGLVLIGGVVGIRALLDVGWAQDVAASA